MGKFTIQVRFLGGLTKTQRKVFKKAAARWQQVIVGDLPPVKVRGEHIDDLVIEAQGVTIDGPNKILGQAGPTVLRPGTLLPAKGIMEFDTADLAQMEEEGVLQSVIIHEMGHVLGIGTIWEELDLLEDAGGANPVFTGDGAVDEFDELTRLTGETPVPVENKGGPGTRDGHWRESVFGNEIMTGFLSGVTQPFSRMTIASLADLRYKVNLAAADPFILPTSLQLAVMGIGADESQIWRCSHSDRRYKPRKPKVLPKSAML